jgi:hypothetical protein
VRTSRSVKDGSHHGPVCEIESDAHTVPDIYTQLLPSAEALERLAFVQPAALIAIPYHCCGNMFHFKYTKAGRWTIVGLAELILKRNSELLPSRTPQNIPRRRHSPSNDPLRRKSRYPGLATAGRYSGGLRRRRHRCDQTVSESKANASGRQ